MPSLSAAPRELDIAAVGPDDWETGGDERDPESEGGPGKNGVGTIHSQPAGTGPPRGGMRRTERWLTAIMIALMLLIPAAIIITESRDHKGGGPAPDDDEHGQGTGWPVHMSVDGKRTLSGQKLEVRGDIIVKRGAELNIADCDLTMNGTFIVYGKLSICNTRLQDFTPVKGLYYGGREGSNLSLPVDLRRCMSAALHIKGMSGYPMMARLQAYFISNGVTTPGPLLELDDTAGFQNVSVDLTAFCGNNITVMLGPLQGVFTQFSLYGLELVTDKGTASYDLAAARLGEEWSFHDFRFPFSINVVRGGLVLYGATLTQFDDDKELIHASEADVKIAGSTLQLEPGLAGDTHGASFFISGFNTSLDMSGSKLLNNSGIDLDNSVLSINDSTFFNQSEAVNIVDTDLRMDRSHFDRCFNGITATRDIFNRGKGLFRMKSTVMENITTGITLANISASIEDTTISGGYAPLVVYVRSDLSREDCTVENVLGMVNDTIGNRWNEQGFAAIELFSSIPVAGLDRLLRSNHLNSSIILERYLLIDYPAGSFVQQLEAQLFYNRSGMSGSYDLQMDTTGERPFTDGWQRAENYYGNPWEVPARLLQSYTHKVAIERIELDGAGYSFDKLDEGAISFRAVSDEGIGYRTYDARGLLHPPDALAVNITFEDLCDLSIVDLTQMFHYTETNEPVLSISYYVSAEGRTVRDFQATCTIGSVRLLRIEKVEDYSHMLDIDLRRIREGGELVLSIEAIGARDENLSNNEARMNITVINASCRFTGPVEITGLWLLAEDANLTFSNCTLTSHGRWSAIIGKGRNRIDMDNSTINMSTLFLNVDNGSLRNTDITRTRSPDEVFVPEYSRISVSGMGNWTMENVSCGYRAREFQQLSPGGREAFFAELMDDASSIGFYYYMMYFTIGAGNVSILGSTFFLLDWVLFSSAACLTISNTTVLWAHSAMIDAENVTISDSDFQDLVIAYATGSNMTVERNLFHNISEAVTLGCTGRNCTFRDNRLELGGALELAGPESPRVENNTFRGMPTAIIIQCPGEPGAIIPLNRFEGISGYLVQEQRSITLELSQGLVNSTADSSLSQLTVEWEDLLSLHRASTYMRQSSLDRNITVFGTNDLKVVMHTIDRNGTVNHLTVIPVKITVNYSHRPALVMDRIIAIRSDSSWTEYIE